MAKNGAVAGAGASHPRRRSGTRDANNGGLVVVESLEALDAALVNGFRPQILVAADPHGHGRVAQLVCHLRAGGVPVLVIAHAAAGLGARLVDTIRELSDIHAVLCCAASLDPILDLVGDGDLAFREGDPPGDIAFLATRPHLGWTLFEAVTVPEHPATAMDGVAVAGLSIDFDIGGASEGSRVGTLRSKLREAGARILNRPHSTPFYPAVVLRDCDESLRAGYPAIGLNLAGQEEDPLPVWVQAPGFEQQYLPAIVRALEAVAATPLNQWRRWLA